MSDESVVGGLKPRSREVTDGFERAPARAMLRAVGMTDDDWDKPQVGVASSWNEVTPCNMPLDRLAKRAKEGVRDAGGFPIEFTTIAVSDGISMGHEGMRASLVSREVIADSVETRDARRALRRPGHLRRLRQVAARDADGRGPAQPAVGVPLRRVDPARASTTARPSTSSACSRPSAPTPPAPSTTRSSAPIERNACPTEGACAGMFTANTMASVAEALGMSLPGSASAAGRRPPPRRLRLRVRRRPSCNLLELGIRPRQIMTKEAFENAIAVVMALGGSTNAVLHLLAIAHEAEVELELDDFNRVAARVPHIADTKPHGKYHMIDLDRIGGVPVVMTRAARRRAAPRRLPDRHRQDDGREPGRPRPARARRRGRAPADRPDPRRRRHRHPHAARWPRRAPW